MPLNKNLIVIAPHPDDEVIGLGGTLLKKKKEGFNTYCIFLTSLKKTNSSKKAKKIQIDELKKSTKILQLNEIFQLDYRPAELEQISRKNLIQKISKIFKKLKPIEVYIPSLGDIHSDHQVAHEIGLSCCKWFRNKFIKKVLSYETLSESHLIKSSKSKIFNPNYFVDISNQLKIKILAFKVYKSQIQKHPYPRNLNAIKSLSVFRGTSSGYKYAEAFEILYFVD
jgi:LmbE family N-acetylglucosaminyl deacetylase